jgi:hypothetical protein
MFGAYPKVEHLKGASLRYLLLVRAMQSGAIKKYFSILYLKRIFKEKHTNTGFYSFALMEQHIFDTNAGKQLS